MASSSHTPAAIIQQAQPTNGSYGDSPVSSASPLDAYHDAVYDLGGPQDDDQWQDAVSSPEFEDRMFGQNGLDGQRSEGLQNGTPNGVPTSQPAALEGPADSPVANGSQHLSVDGSKREAIKRLVAKRAALSGFASPSPSFQAPSRAAGLHHTTLLGVCAFISNLVHLLSCRMSCQAVRQPIHPRCCHIFTSTFTYKHALTLPSTA